MSMKSLQNEATAHCPHGCEEFDISYWSFVRADGEEDLKSSILAGELNLVRCPHCGTFFHHDGELVYIDAPAELLVFVFSQKDKPREQELRAKMTQDYQSLKPVLLHETGLSFAPVCVFGLEELQHLLRHEEERSEESAVIAAASAQQGFQVARLRPVYAREHHFPLYIPAPSSKNPSANDYAVAAARVLQSGLNSPLLLHFKDAMSQQGAQSPVLL